MEEKAKQTGTDPLRDPVQTQIATSWETAAGTGTRKGARAHLAVALPPDLLAAAVGAGANGVQHLVVLRPGRHGRGGGTPADRAAAAGLEPPSPQPPRVALRPPQPAAQFNRPGPWPRSPLAHTEAASPL